MSRLRRNLCRAAICGLFLHIGADARAQFYLLGSESPSVKWNQIQTADYNFIYPSAYDSLARSYAMTWEKYKFPVGNSIGAIPNEAYDSPLPVVLHPYVAYSNGSVIWTPRRMEMYTSPDMFNPEPLPWSTMLAIHEQRHVSQMQFVHQEPFKWTSVLCGELLAGPISVIRFDPAHFEGDAVTAETALTHSGRARTAEFLEYYRACLAEGDMRNYERWRFGSQKLYTPDYYKLGYLAIGGMRAVYDKPLLMQAYYGSYLPYHRFIKKETGQELQDAFEHVLSVQDEIWRANEFERAPFQKTEQVTQTEEYFTSYSSIVKCKGNLYALRSGMNDAKALARIYGDKAVKLQYSSASSALYSDGKRIYWSEYIPHPRWELQSSSVIKYYDRGVHTLSDKGKKYYNPTTYKDRVIVCESAPDGSSYITVLTSASGSVVSRHKAPDGISPYEAVCINGNLICAAVSDKGEGLYRVSDFECILDGGFVKINHLFVHEDKLYFTSDRTGVEELYMIDVAALHNKGTDADINDAEIHCTQEVHQVTNLRLGGQNFCFGDDGYLYFTALKSDGRMIYRTALADLPIKGVDFSEHCSYPLEDRLSEQEKLIAQATQKSREGITPPESPDQTQSNTCKLKDTCVSSPKKYSKASHALNVHSWLPFYVDYDELMSSSAETLLQNAGLGGTVFLQNTLSTIYGSAGYHYNPWADASHSFMASVTYRGLYPVINNKTYYNLNGTLSNKLNVYIPFNLSSNGWSRSVIPYIKSDYTHSDSLSYSVGKIGLRAYSILPTPAARSFPQLGLGMDFGLKYFFGALRPEMTVYGYTPGISGAQGLAFSYSVGTAPFSHDKIAITEGLSLNTSTLSLAYSIPFLSVDWNGLSPICYVRNFELMPRFRQQTTIIDGDLSKYDAPDLQASRRIYKFGTDLSVVLGNILFVPYDFHIGLGAYYIHGDIAPGTKPYEINLIFSVDI